MDAEEQWAWRREESEAYHLHRLFWNDKYLNRVAEAITAPEWTDLRELQTDSPQIRLPRHGLLSLPTDLLHCIFDEVTELTDVLNLFAAHDRLMLVGVYHVRHMVDRLIAPWRGQRLVCLGNHCELPEEVAPPLKRKLATVLSRSNRKKRARQGDAATDEGLDDEDNMDAQYGGMTVPEVLDYIFDGILREPGAHVARFFKLYAWLEAGRPTVTRPLSQLVLRNRAMREYVRGAALVPLRARCQASSEQSGRAVDVTLGHALLVQICWSTEAPAWATDEDSAETCERLASGPWAGDPVDIVSVDKAELRQEWKDCSGEVVTLLEKLFDNPIS